MPHDPSGFIQSYFIFYKPLRKNFVEYILRNCISNKKIFIKHLLFAGHCAIKVTWNTLFVIYCIDSTFMRSLGNSIISILQMKKMRLKQKVQETQVKLLSWLMNVDPWFNSFFFLILCSCFLNYSKNLVHCMTFYKQNEFTSDSRHTQDQADFQDNCPAP